MILQKHTLKQYQHIKKFPFPQSIISKLTNNTHLVYCLALTRSAILHIQIDFGKAQWLAKILFKYFT